MDLQSKLIPCDYQVCCCGRAFLCFEQLYSFFPNVFRVLDARRVRVGRGAVWCGVAVVLALIVAVPVTLMFQYGAGTHHWDAWGTGAVPRYPFDRTVQIKQRLRAQGQRLVTTGEDPDARWQPGVQRVQRLPVHSQRCRRVRPR